MNLILRLSTEFISLQNFQFISSPSTKIDPPTKSATMTVINERIKSFFQNNTSFDSIKDWIDVSIK